MKIDILVAEIGSTTTLVNAFNNIDSQPIFLGQGQANTTVEEGDVNIGLVKAIDDLTKKLSIETIDYKDLLASSSAAGGLRMTVHGLVYDMTVKAAREAALGAGANISLVTAGKLRKSDLKKIKEIKPNIILIAGGVDYGERDTSLHNAEMIGELNLDIPIIYAGNIENHEDIKDIFDKNNTDLYIVDNVYPKIDELNVGPTRKVIQEVFEKHIIHAQGMENVGKMVSGSIMPTPGAVMEASELLYSDIGDLVTIDVGGATTDIHSVTEDSDEISKILLHPEPKSKRSVEGDLGVFINVGNIIDIIGKENLSQDLNITLTGVEKLISNHKPIPETCLEKKFVEIMTLHAAKTAIKRHGGRLKDIYGPSGKKTIAQGKDLTQVKYIIGTGGALAKLSEGGSILKAIPYSNKGNELLPNTEVKILLDKDYIMASLGVMAKKYPQVALKLLKSYLKEE